MRTMRTMRTVRTVIRNYLIVSTLLPIVLSWEPPPTPEAPVCTSPQCKARGTMYFKNMYSPGNPCQNFYKFVCGNWGVQNPTPGYEPDWSVHCMMKTQTLNQLQNVLKKPTTRSETPEEQRAKRVFKTCMDIPSLGRGDTSFVVKHMDKIGFYPSTSVWDIHNEYVKLTGESPLFDFRIMADSVHNDEPLIQFKDSLSVYGYFVQLRTWSIEQWKTYLSFLVNLVKAVRNKKYPIEDTVLIQKIKDVITFRNKLNKIGVQTSVDDNNSLQPVTVNELQQWYNRYTRQAKTAQINWDTIVRNLYHAVVDPPLLSNPRVGFRDKDYFIALADLLSTTSEETLAYHIEVYFMERHVTFTTPVLEKLKELLTKMNGFTGFVRREEIERSLKCAEDLDMDEVEGKLYVANYFKKEHVPMVEDMLLEIKDAFKLDIIEAKWPDKETKVASIRRVNDITWWIGYPPWYDNPSVKPELTYMKPATINANLASLTNRIYVNAAFMKSPMFDPQLPAVYNYAAMGTTLGHEMYHSMDDCGKFQTALGEIKIWWSPDMREKCLIRRQCYIDQYTQLGLLELGSVPKGRAPSPGTIMEMSSSQRTYMEDLADSMGLQTAFRAYQAKVKKHKKACAVLPHFERYSCEQMFFISFANAMCGKEEPEIAYAPTRSHSALSVRVNAAVMNNEDFGRVFGCTKTNPMYPTSKCNLWI